MRRTLRLHRRRPQTNFFRRFTRFRRSRRARRPPFSRALPFHNITIFLPRFWRTSCLVPFATESSQTVLLPANRQRFLSKCSADSQENAILWQPVAYPSNFKEKETAMFQKLMNTSDDFVVTLLRLALGAVFFVHGAQKALGWFGGFGFRATGFLYPADAHPRSAGGSGYCRR